MTTPDSDSPAICACDCGLPGCISYRGPRQRLHGSAIHGTLAAARNGCKCDLCKDAKALQNAHLQRARQVETLAGARKRGQEWTGPELEIALRDDLTGREAALLLGRTYAAVMKMRHRCRTEPKYTALAGVSDGRSS